MILLTHRCVIAQLLGAAILFSACTKSSNEENSQSRDTTYNDTLIATRVVTNELAGADYRQNATQYLLVVKGDTSQLRLIAARARQSGKISFDIRFHKTLSYANQYKVLQKLIPYAFKHFPINPDSMQTIFLGRLITTGDLAVNISRAYEKRYGADKRLSTELVLQHMMHSKLTEDWNTLLKPFQVEVDAVTAEKIFFTENKDLRLHSVIESSPETIPEKILDCMVWIRLKRKDL